MGVSSFLEFPQPSPRPDSPSPACPGHQALPGFPHLPAAFVLTHPSSQTCKRNLRSVLLRALETLLLDIWYQFGRNKLFQSLWAVWAFPTLTVPRKAHMVHAGPEKRF